MNIESVCVPVCVRERERETAIEADKMVVCMFVVILLTIQFQYVKILVRL